MSIPWPPPGRRASGSGPRACARPGASCVARDLAHATAARGGAPQRHYARSARSPWLSPRPPRSTTSPRAHRRALWLHGLRGSGDAVSVGILIAVGLVLALFWFTLAVVRRGVIADFEHFYRLACKKGRHGQRGAGGGRAAGHPGITSGVWSGEWPVTQRGARV